MPRCLATATHTQLPSDSATRRTPAGARVGVSSEHSRYAANTSTCALCSDVSPDVVRSGSPARPLGRARYSGHDGARARPEVDAGVLRELVDGRELVGVEGEILRRREVVFELLHARGSDQH